MKDVEYSTVDRFEGEMVIVELPDKQMISIKKDDLPPDISPGDKIFKEETGNWVIDKKKTEDEQKRIRNLMDSLFE